MATVLITTGLAADGEAAAATACGLVRVKTGRAAKAVAPAGSLAISVAVTTVAWSATSKALAAAAAVVGIGLSAPISCRADVDMAMRAPTCILRMYLQEALTVACTPPPSMTAEWAQWFPK